jgi:HlyD family secretion protein
MKKLRIALLIIILFIIFLTYNSFIQKKEIEDYINATGLIETTEVNLSSKIPGRIVWLCCREGDTIKAESLAIRVDDAELRARLEVGGKGLEETKASLSIEEANLNKARLEVDAAKAEVQALEADIIKMNALTEDARKNIQRSLTLFKEGLISEKELDLAKANYDFSNAQLDSTRAHKMAADANLKNSIANINKFEAQLSSARIKVEESQATVKLLETQLRDTEITSPLDGVIVYKAFEIGEIANPGTTIYTIHDLKNVWARADIEETMIGKIKLSDKAKVIAAAIPDIEFDGEVIEIGREGEFATQRDVTRGRSDIRTFRVKVGIGKPDGLLKSGMTVRVKIFYR